MSTIKQPSQRISSLVILFDINGVSKKLADIVCLAYSIFEVGYFVPENIKGTDRYRVTNKYDPLVTGKSGLK